jgi:hypothetical protein
MTSRKYGALIASLSAITLMLAANETFAGTAAASHGATMSTHSLTRPSIAQPFQQHRRNNLGTFWPGGDFSYGPNGEPIGNVGQPASGDVHYTYTYDVPWDWAHRYPPAVAPSDRPYAPGCGTEAVTVPGRDGADRTINIMRCY